jgi:hypothetical protein
MKVFGDRVLRRIFGPKRYEMVVGWKKLRIAELCNLCSSPNIIRMIKLRRMRLAGNVARVGEKMNACRILVEKPK